MASTGELWLGKVKEWTEARSILLYQSHRVLGAELRQLLDRPESVRLR
jgi:hypothetical protein